MLALVTGGHRRLGGAIAAALGAAGYALALHGSHDAAPDAALAEALAAHGVTWRGFVADFADPARAEALVGEVTRHFGHAPDLLVNCASLFGQDDLATTDAATLMRHYAVGAAAPALLTRAFAAAGGEGAGDRSIVNLLDQRLAQPHGDQLAYTMAKHALAGLTRIGARALAPAVRVNAVAPGLTVVTDDYDTALTTRVRAMMPLRRLPAPAEVAEAVLYLARARSVTGQTITVDGGAHLESFARDFMYL